MVILAIAALMFIFFAFFPVCDVLGKAKVNGLKLVFEGKGLGLSRFLALLMLVLPVIIALTQLNVKGLSEKALEAPLFIAGVLLFLVFALVLNEACSIAAGGYLYLFASVIGVAVTYLPRFTAKK